MYFCYSIRSGFWMKIFSSKSQEKFIFFPTSLSYSLFNFKNMPYVYTKFSVPFAEYSDVLPSFLPKLGLSLLTVSWKSGENLRTGLRTWTARVTSNTSSIQQHSRNSHLKLSRIIVAITLRCLQSNITIHSWTNFSPLWIDNGKGVEMMIVGVALWKLLRQHNITPEC